jgi:hypothetical protein
MKVIFGLVLFLTFLELHAVEIRVKKLARDGELERSFVLKTNMPERIVLDCQSFIQGLRVGEFESAYTFMLEPDECSDLHIRIKSSLRKFQNHCIDVDQDIRADYTCN